MSGNDSSDSSELESMYGSSNRQSTKLKSRKSRSFPAKQIILSSSDDGITTTIQNPAGTREHYKGLPACGKQKNNLELLEKENVSDIQNISSGTESPELRQTKVKENKISKLDIPNITVSSSDEFSVFESKKNRKVDKIPKRGELYKKTTRRKSDLIKQRKENLATNKKGKPVNAVSGKEELIEQFSSSSDEYKMVDINAKKGRSVIECDLDSSDEDSVAPRNGTSGREAHNSNLSVSPVIKRTTNKNKETRGNKSKRKNNKQLKSHFNSPVIAIQISDSEDEFSTASFIVDVNRNKKGVPEKKDDLSTSSVDSQDSVPLSQRKPRTTKSIHSISSPENALQKKIGFPKLEYDLHKLATSISKESVDHCKTKSSEDSDSEMIPPSQFHRLQTKYKSNSMYSVLKSSGGKFTINQKNKPSIKLTENMKLDERGNADVHSHGGVGVAGGSESGDVELKKPIIPVKNIAVKSTTLPTRPLKSSVFYHQGPVRPSRTPAKMAKKSTSKPSRSAVFLSKRTVFGGKVHQLKKLPALSGVTNLKVKPQVVEAKATCSTFTHIDSSASHIGSQLDGSKELPEKQRMHETPKNADIAQSGVQVQPEKDRDYILKIQEKKNAVDKKGFWTGVEKDMEVAWTDSIGSSSPLVPPHLIEALESQPSMDDEDVTVVPESDQEDVFPTVLMTPAAEEKADKKQSVRANLFSTSDDSVSLLTEEDLFPELSTSKEEDAFHVNDDDLNIVMDNPNNTIEENELTVIVQEKSNVFDESTIDFTKFAQGIQKTSETGSDKKCSGSFSLDLDNSCDDLVERKVEEELDTSRGKGEDWKTHDRVQISAHGSEVDDNNSTTIDPQSVSSHYSLLDEDTILIGDDDDYDDNDDEFFAKLTQPVIKIEPKSEPQSDDATGDGDSDEDDVILIEDIASESLLCESWMDLDIFSQIPSVSREEDMEEESATVVLIDGRRGDDAKDSDPDCESHLVATADVKDSDSDCERHLVATTDIKNSDCESHLVAAAEAAESGRPMMIKSTDGTTKLHFVKSVKLVPKKSFPQKQTFKMFHPENSPSLCEGPVEREIEEENDALKEKGPTEIEKKVEEQILNLKEKVPTEVEQNVKSEIEKLKKQIRNKDSDAHDSSSDVEIVEVQVNVEGTRKKRKGKMTKKVEDVESKVDEDAPKPLDADLSVDAMSDEQFALYMAEKYGAGDEMEEAGMSHNKEHVVEKEDIASWTSLKKNKSKMLNRKRGRKQKYVDLSDSDSDKSTGVENRNKCKVSPVLSKIGQTDEAPSVNETLRVGKPVRKKAKHDDNLERKLGEDGATKDKKVETQVAQKHFSVPPPETRNTQKIDQVKAKKSTRIKEITPQHHVPGKTRRLAAKFYSDKSSVEPKAAPPLLPPVLTSNETMTVKKSKRGWSFEKKEKGSKRKKKASEVPLKDAIHRARRTMQERHRHPTGDSDKDPADTLGTEKQDELQNRKADEGMEKMAENETEAGMGGQKSASASPTPKRQAANRTSEPSISTPVTSTPITFRSDTSIPIILRTKSKSPTAINTTSQLAKGTNVQKKVPYLQQPVASTKQRPLPQQHLQPQARELPRTAVSEPLVPRQIAARSVAPNTDPVPITLEEYIATVTRWNPVWLKEEASSDKSSTPPPVANQMTNRKALYPALSDNQQIPLPPLLMSGYSSLRDYVTITYPLMLYETWAHLYQEWSTKRGKNNLFNVAFSHFTDCKLTNYLDLLVQGVLSRQQIERGNYPSEGHVVILLVKIESAGKQPSSRAVMAYVMHTSKIPITRHRDQEQIHPLLSGNALLNEKGSLLLNCSLRIFRRKLNIDKNSMASVEMLDSIIPLTRQVSALDNLHMSRLAREILRPTNVRPTFFHKPIYSTKALKAYYNDSQVEAIGAVGDAILQPYAVPKICLIQGPPGTGKSHTIVGIIKRALTQKTQDSGNTPKIMVTGPSNAAVDELVKKLIKDRGDSRRWKVSINFVRVGNQSSINAMVKQFSLDFLVKQEAKKMVEMSSVPDSVRTELEEVTKKLDKLKGKLTSVYARNDGREIREVQDEIRKMNKRRQQLQGSKGNTKVTLTHGEERKIRQRILQEADVVCCTLNGSGNLGLLRDLTRDRKNRPHFTAIIVDEASQTTELDCLIPLQYGCTKLVMVGDPEQLPATVLSQTASNLSYGQSLFERFQKFFKDRDEDPVKLLTTQYRMHPDICAFPSSHVYGGKLVTDRGTAEQRDGWPYASYQVFDIAYGQEVQHTTGFVNQEEVAFTVALCTYLISKAHQITTNSIGIITPYQQQRAALTKALQYRHMEIEVGTVDGFQGREKDVIILSCVRAQSQTGTIGFLKDRRRMNVSLTRARYALYVVGHLRSLWSNPDWKKLVSDAQSRHKLTVVPSRDLVDHRLHNGLQKLTRGNVRQARAEKMPTTSEQNRHHPHTMPTAFMMPPGGNNWTEPSSEKAFPSGNSKSKISVNNNKQSDSCEISTKSKLPSSSKQKELLENGQKARVLPITASKEKGPPAEVCSGVDTPVILAESPHLPSRPGESRDPRLRKKSEAPHPSEPTKGTATNRPLKSILKKSELSSSSTGSNTNQNNSGEDGSVKAVAMSAAYDEMYNEKITTKEKSRHARSHIKDSSKDKDGASSGQNEGSKDSYGKHFKHSDRHQERSSDTPNSDNKLINESGGKKSEKETQEHHRSRHQSKRKEGKNKDLISRSGSRVDVNRERRSEDQISQSENNRTKRKSEFKDRRETWSKENDMSESKSEDRDKRAMKSKDRDSEKTKSKEHNKSELKSEDRYKRSTKSKDRDSEKTKSKEHKKSELKSEDRYKRSTKSKDRDSEKTKSKEHKKSELKSGDRDKRDTKSKDRDSEKTKSKEHNRSESKSEDRDKRDTKSKDRDSEKTKSKEHNRSESKSEDRDKRDTKSKDRDSEKTKSKENNRSESKSREWDKRDSRSKEKENRKDSRESYTSDKREHNSCAKTTVGTDPLVKKGI